MDKSDDAIKDIYRAALLHDLGKIAISNEVLNKSDTLSPEEYAVIKNHTVIRTKILKEILELPALSIGTHWQHERYDGTEYPHGLAGEDIPEYAKIICVADCYNAMSSNRSYRKALPQDMVRQDIEHNMGTQFDPEIAKVMLGMIDEDKDYKMRKVSEQGQG